RYHRYEWSTGETTESIYVNEPGTYWVNLYNSSGCMNTDTIEIFKQEEPKIFESRFVSMCYGEPVTLEANVPGATFTWQDSSSLNYFVAEKAGTYTVSIETEGGCILEDSVIVTYTDCPEKFNIPNVITPNN